LATKRGYHHGNLRTALVNAALRELALTGPAEFSLRSVARRAGVSAPAVYRHFQDREDLLAAVAVECAERLAAALTAAVDAAPAAPLERFRATGIAYLRFAVAHPDYFHAMSVPGLLDRTPPEQRAQMTAWRESQRAALVDAQAAGLISSLPIDDILIAASATMNGLAHMILEGQLGEVDDARATELAITATAALGAGFWPRPEGFQDPLTGVHHPGVPKPR
jgi:AcrR family transcriptional regulator